MMNDEDAAAHNALLELPVEQDYFDTLVAQGDRCGGVSASILTAAAGLAPPGRTTFTAGFSKGFHRRSQQPTPTQPSPWRFEKGDRCLVRNCQRLNGAIVEIECTPSQSQSQNDGPGLYRVRVVSELPGNVLRLGVIRPPQNQHGVVLEVREVNLAQCELTWTSELNDVANDVCLQTQNPCYTYKAAVCASASAMYVFGGLQRDGLDCECAYHAYSRHSYACILPSAFTLSVRLSLSF
jgi:hypothetical protein